jgi:hypothetical protein
VIFAAGFSPAGVLAYVAAGAALAAVIYRFRRQVLRGIPNIDATTLGLWRILFGVWLFVGTVHELRLPDIAAAGTDFESQLWGDWGWVEYLSEHWNLRDALWLATLAAIVTFTAGFLTRLSYLALVAGFVVRLTVAQEYGQVSHRWAPYVILLVALLVVPWGDGLSADAWLRRRRGLPPKAREPGPHYGVALWIPGLVLGMVWLAAAWSKLDATGWEWISSGAVKYHWAEDSVSAPTDLGAYIASHQALAVLFSAAGVLAEATFWLHIFFRSSWVRLAFFGLGLSLLGGFYLFQGVFWFPWWLLLLALLPWQPISERVQALVPRLRTVPERPAVAHRWTLAFGLPLSVAVAFLVTQQVAISAERVEQIPFFTNYPMYNWTYDSEAEFNARVRDKFTVYQFRDATQDSDPNIERNIEELGVSRSLGEIAELANGNPGLPLHERWRQELDFINRKYQDEYGRPLGVVVPSAIYRRFDFRAGELRKVKNVALRPLDVPRLLTPIAVPTWEVQEPAWTVSLGVYSTQAAAEARARELAPGAIVAGVLPTAGRPGLPADRFIVFYGSYGREREARSAEAQLKSRGYDTEGTLRVPSLR